VRLECKAPADGSRQAWVLWVTAASSRSILPHKRQGAGIAIFCRLLSDIHNSITMLTFNQLAFSAAAKEDKK
jgi:hypothetical protein